MLRMLSTLLLVVCIAFPVLAQPVSMAEVESLLDRFAGSAETVEAQLEQGILPDDALDAMRAEIEEQRSELALIEEQTQAVLAPLRDQLAPLVPEDGSETADPEEAQRRATLEGEIAELESAQRRGKQAVARANALSERLNRERRERFANALLKRGPSPVLPQRIANMWASVSFKARVILREFTTRFQADASGVHSDRIALPVVLGLLAILLGIGVRRWLVRRLLESLGDDASSGRKASIGCGLVASRLLVPTLALVMIYYGLSASGIVGPVFEKVLKATFLGAMVVFGSYALSGAFFAPGAATLRLSSLDDRAAARSHRWLILIAVVLALDHIVIVGGRDIGLSIDALAVLNAGLLILGGLSLALFVHHARLGLPPKTRDQLLAESDMETLPPPPLIERAARFARFVARGISVLAPALALIGYFGASRYVFYPPVLSGALIFVCILIYNVVAVGTANAAETTNAEGQEDDAATLSPFGIVPVFVGFVLFLIILPLLAMIWGADTTDLGSAWTRILEGFVIGEVKLSPIDFVLFVIVFMIGYFLTRSVQGILRRSVLPLTRMDQGAQSALTAGLGYVGITISALIAISTTGLDLSNIAIVAGALSVGIGFGLQNIVNNFVSGIILLIERPIKAGDWVEIGGVHGTVQQVNVRSTEITTFDRSTMFVPNADLISGTVTNWTHSNSMGRLIVPVGVAYGSDARQVEKILLEIARAQPSLLRRPEPYVVFSGFGADSIDFEIRGVLRDVNWILNVGSDIRHSIYERFAEEGIEIPFAQRDVFIKNIDAIRKD